MKYIYNRCIKVNIYFKIGLGLSEFSQKIVVQVPSLLQAIFQ